MCICFCQADTFDNYPFRSMCSMCFNYLINDIDIFVFMYIKSTYRNIYMHADIYIYIYHIYFLNRYILGLWVRFQKPSEWSRFLLKKTPQVQWFSAKTSGDATAVQACSILTSVCFFCKSGHKQLMDDLNIESICAGIIQWDPFWGESNKQQLCGKFEGFPFNGALFKGW